MQGLNQLWLGRFGTLTARFWIDGDFANMEMTRSTAMKNENEHLKWQVIQPLEQTDVTADRVEVRRRCSPSFGGFAATCFSITAVGRRFRRWMGD